WWLALERVIVNVNALNVKIDGVPRRLSCATRAEKDAAFHIVYWWLRSIDEVEARAFVHELCAEIDFDPRQPQHRLDDDVAGDPPAGDRSAHHHWRPHAASLWAGQADDCRSASRDRGKRAAHRAGDRQALQAFQLPLWRCGKCGAVRVRYGQG